MPRPAAENRHLYTFAGIRQVWGLQKPEQGKPYLEYRHAEISAFYVRIHPSNRRQWVCRLQRPVLQTDGRYKTKDDRKAFADVPQNNKSPAPGEMSYEDALAYVLKAKRDLEDAKSSTPGKKRWTVEEVWTHRKNSLTLLREETVKKENRLYRDYISHFAKELMDTIDLTRVEAFSVKLQSGTFQPTRKALSTETVRGILTLLGTLYNIAHQNDALGDRPRDWNPAELAKAKLPVHPGRRTYLKLTKIAEAWRAADVICSAWARDQMRLYLLTGLRRSVLTDLKFSDVDFDAGLVTIPPTRKGTKRRARNELIETEPIVVPLSVAALRILKARREVAKAKDGFVWYVASKLSGRGKAVRHSDPRSNWNNVSEYCDIDAFSPHDLRRTFASVASAQVRDEFAISLLMMQKATLTSQTGEKPAAVTRKYIMDPVVLKRLRDCAEGVSLAVKEMLAGTSQILEEVELPPSLVALLEEEEE